MTIIEISATPESYHATATFCDGGSARAVPVTVSIDTVMKSLVIAADTRRLATWPLADIRLLPGQVETGGDVACCGQNNLARLYMADSRLETQLPDPHRPAKHVDRRPLIAWGLAALASIAVILLVLLPIIADGLARYIPPKGEKALGDATLLQIRHALSNDASGPVPFCEASEGRAALDKMALHLTKDLDLPHPITVQVLDDGKVNAFALPGGHVVFFRGLLSIAKTPEEIAAVFAHEIGHVAARDPTRIALRSAGSIGVLGLLFGDFAGGTIVLFLTERIIEADYSQEAEAAADGFAHTRLKDVRVRPDALGDMFERIRDRYGDTTGFVGHFMAHPELGDRIEAARRKTPENFAAEPILTSAEWEALKRICD